MMNPTMRPIHSLIEAKVLDRVKNVQSLTTSLRSRLSSDLRQHCWVVDVAGNTLVLVTDNAERATILRYQQHELVKQVNEEFARTLTTPVRRIKIKIDYNLSQSETVKTPDDSRSDNDTRIARHHCQQMLSLLSNPDET